MDKETLGRRPFVARSLAVLGSLPLVPACACFRICSTCRSRSQARLCLCTLWLISKQPERTFVRLRYSLGGDRPSQTTRLAVSCTRMTGDS